MSDGVRWIFGYGSLVWRPAFPFEERVPASIAGWARRFWQGSPDHRGVPEAPGRVVTLVAEPGARCGGLAYRVRPGHWPAVLEALDLRESGGFERLRLPLRFAEPGRDPVEALVYVAGPGNPNYLGPAPSAEIARQVGASAGASGPNAEYVLRLDVSLRALGAPDDHVAEIAALLRSRGYDPGPPPTTEE